jgi:hypothetical protein
MILMNERDVLKLQRRKKRIKPAEVANYMNCKRSPNHSV